MLKRKMIKYKLNTSLFRLLFETFSGCNAFILSKYCMNLIIEMKKSCVLNSN